MLYVTIPSKGILLEENGIQAVISCNHLVYLKEKMHARIESIQLEKLTEAARSDLRRFVTNLASFCL
jgi:hypothetical protein